MSWQSSHTAADRFFGSLVYLLPIVDAYYFGIFVFAQFPIVQQLYLPLQPLIYLDRMRIGGIISGGFVIFLVLYMSVVNNRQISRFIRFNTLQAILIGIVISLCSIVLGYFLTPLLIGMPATQVLMTIVFLLAIAISGYGIVMSALGKYAELAQLSEAAHMQIDRYY
jgi:Chloroplast import apparatus Tic20-like